MESGVAGLELSKNPTIELLAQQIEQGKLLTTVERERRTYNLEVSQDIVFTGRVRMSGLQKASGTPTLLLMCIALEQETIICRYGG